MNRSRVRLALLVAILTLTACARGPVQPVPIWPADLPPIVYYADVYAQDEGNQRVQSRQDYLAWVVRFYEGWKLHQDGWRAVTRDVLLAIDDPSRKTRMKKKMHRLGRLISSEWAKNARNRRIRSQQLSVWGQALLRSIERNREERLIDRVTEDVEGLLAGRLEPSDIELERY